MAMQEGHLRQIRDEFHGMVRAVVPLHDSEIRGPGMLEAAQALFA